jgi:hypothetical protein
MICNNYDCIAELLGKLNTQMAQSSYCKNGNQIAAHGGAMTKGIAKRLAELGHLRHDHILHVGFQEMESEFDKPE